MLFSRSNNVAIAGDRSEIREASKPGAELPASIIVRIDEPAIISTRSDPLVSIAGWVFVPETTGAAATAPASSDLMILLEPAGPLPDQNPLLAGVRLSALSLPLEGAAGIAGAKLRLRPAVDYSDPLSGISGVRFDFEGQADFTSLLEHSSPTATSTVSFRILAGCRIGEKISCSNPVTLSFCPAEKLMQPAGGFIQIEPPQINAPFLHIRGWALAGGEAAETVVITINGMPAADAVVGISSPEQARILPGSKGSGACIFEAIIGPEKLRTWNTGLGGPPVPLLVTASAAFHSGEKLRFDSFLTHFCLTDFRPQLPSGRIEKVSISESGQLRIDGSLLNPSYSALQFRFSTLRGYISLPEDERGIVRRFERPDIDSANPFCTDGRSGFEIQVTPQIFGRAPGIIRLQAVDAESGSVCDLGPEWIRNGITAELAKFRTGLFRSFEDRAARLVSRILPHNAGIPAAKKSTPAALPSDRLLSGKRLLFALHNLSDVEGAPKVIFEAIRSVCRESGGQVRVAVVAGKEGSYRSRLEALGVSVVIEPDLDWGHQTWTRYNAGLASASALLRRFEPDAVIAGVSDCFWALDLAARNGIPALWCIQEGSHPFSKYPDFDPKLRKRYFGAFQTAARVIFVADSTRRLYRGLVDDSRSVVIPNGIDLAALEAEKHKHGRKEARRLIGAGENDTIVSIVGTTTYRKGQDIFLREARILRDLFVQNPGRLRDGGKLRFFIVGARKSDFLFKLQSTARQLDLGDAVTFIAEQPDIARYFIASDLAAICSREEAAPLVSLEALAYGVPLVTTAVQGLAEQIVDRYNGVFFDPEIEGQMAEKAFEVLCSAELRSTIIGGGRASLEQRFSLAASIRRYPEEIAAVIGSAPPRN